MGADLSKNMMQKMPFFVRENETQPSWLRRNVYKENLTFRDLEIERK